MTDCENKCKLCKHDMFEPITNYDRINKMSIEEMAEFIEKDMLEMEGGCIKVYHKCKYTIMCGSCVNSDKCVKKWLESEVTNNGYNTVPA